MDRKENFFSLRVVRHWNRPREVEGFLSLEVLRKCGDAALRDAVSEHGGDGLWLHEMIFSSLFQC